MKEASCKALDIFFWQLPKKGLSPEVLAEGTGYTVKFLRNKNERIEWSAYLQFMRNVGRIWTDDELVGLGKAFFDSPYLKPFAVVARLLFNAKEVYAWIFQSGGMGNQMFTNVQPVFRELDENRVLLEMVFTPGTEHCREFFFITKGTMIAVPRMLGLPYSEVKMERTEEGARFIVTVPPGGGVLRWLRKILLWPFTARSAAKELKEAHESLQVRYEELAQARSELANKADQLYTLNLLGRELVRHTEVGELCDAIVRILTERFKAVAVAVWLVLGNDREERLVVRSGSPLSQEPKQLRLATGGEPLGRVELWGDFSSTEGSGDLLESLLPYLSIAVGNARSFGLLREYQATLEKRVAERTEQLEVSLEQVRHADRVKTNFFSNASHELRTPLTLVLAPLESLERAPGLSTDVRKEIQAALRNGYRLLKLINDLLDLSKMEAGKMQLRMGVTDLRTLLEELVRPWVASLVNRGIELELNLPESLQLIADAERLEQVILNLLSNATKYTPTGGRIVISAREAEGFVEFSVFNTGEGIDEEELPALFDRFAQLIDSRRRRFGSTGLGLPVVRELVELHGGTVEVKSVPGQSVAFTVRLPQGQMTEEDSHGDSIVKPGDREMLQYQLAAIPETAHASNSFDGSAAPQADESRAKILIVEDNAELRNFLIRSLADEFDVLSAGNGIEALRVARDKLPMVILSDLMMPEMDGLELCRAIKGNKETEHIPIVLLTARSDMQVKLTGFSSGADDYLSKPFHVDELKARVRAQVRLRALSAQMTQREKLAALGTLVAGVSHEVRNPLNGIINSLGPLKEMLTEDTQIELVNIAIESCKRVESITGQLLQQARMNEGFRREVDVIANLEFALQLLAHKVRSGPTIERDLEVKGPVFVEGDPGALSQVWINLVDNAIQAAGPSGLVRVVAENKGDGIQVSIIDSGSGIHPKNLSRIFDPFFTTKAVGSGTGLGLWVVREIIEKHGGTIAVASNPNGGACFVVTLPQYLKTGRETVGSLH